MLNFIYWITGIIATFISGYVAYKIMKKIKNIKIQQKAEKMENIKGAEFKLEDGEDIHIKNFDINQEAKQMSNVTGLSFEANGKQSARLQGVKIKQPNAEVIISNDPNVKVEINKSEQ
jgi:hypothetical protein